MTALEDRLIRAATNKWPRQEDFEQVLADGLSTEYVASIIEPLEGGEVTLIARHLAIRCALLVRDYRVSGE